MGITIEEIKKYIQEGFTLPGGSFYFSVVSDNSAVLELIDRRKVCVGIFLTLGKDEKETKRDINVYLKLYNNKLNWPKDGSTPFYKRDLSSFSTNNY